MQPWYKVVVPRKEVREGRSFHPDELAIAVEELVSGDAPGGDVAGFVGVSCGPSASCADSR